MWNEIRHPKYSEVHADGRISYFTGGYNDQMGAETHIIMGVCTSFISSSCVTQTDLEWM